MDGMTDTAQQQLRAQPRLTRPDGSPIRVVVVDDEQSLADLVAMGLKYMGIADSIIGRMERHGGTATIRSEPDQGTEVELIMPRAR